MKSVVGVVVIGRNEGARLVRCLESLPAVDAGVVYVDSASTDGSVAAARRLGAEVVEADPSRPLRAARSRNEGFARLLALRADVTYVQFVDGDCEVREGWIDAARRSLDERPDVAAVCGRLRERRRDASIYNRLCDMEWGGPLGDVDACGGVSMMRADALRRVGGFRTDMAFGEEPELCLRLRRDGWRILRIDAEMALHDAAMDKFGQWWRRAVRGGHAFAEGAALHGRGPERFNVGRVVSVVVWGGVAPTALAVSLVAAFWTPWALLAAGLVAAGYARLALRVLEARRRAGDSSADARLYAAFCVLGKVPQLCGVLLYVCSRMRRRPTAFIEYRTPDFAADLRPTPNGTRAAR